MDISVRTENFGGDDQSWLGSAHGTSSGRTITLSKAAGFVSGTHYPNGYLPSGTKLGVVTASGKYGLYDNAATDGRETLAGFLLTPVPVTAGADLVAALYEHGPVVEANLPFAIDSAGKADVAGRIWFR